MNFSSEIKRINNRLNAFNLLLQENNPRAAYRTLMKADKELQRVFDLVEQQHSLIVKRYSWSQPLYPEVIEGEWQAESLKEVQEELFDRFLDRTG